MVFSQKVSIFTSVHKDTEVFQTWSRLIKVNYKHCHIQFCASLLIFSPIFGMKKTRCFFNIVVISHNRTNLISLCPILAALWVVRSTLSWECRLHTVGHFFWAAMCWNFPWAKLNIKQSGKWIIAWRLVAVIRTPKVAVNKFTQVYFWLTDRLDILDKLRANINSPLEFCVRPKSHKIYFDPITVPCQQIHFLYRYCDIC